MGFAAFGKAMIATGLLAVTACSSDDPAVERSAESFCARWEALDPAIGDDAEIFDAEPTTPALLRELANRSPNAELTDALNELARTQPRWRDELERARENQDTDPPGLVMAWFQALRETVDGATQLCL